MSFGFVDDIQVARFYRPVVFFNCVTYSALHFDGSEYLFVWVKEDEVLIWWCHIFQLYIEYVVEVNLGNA